MYLKGLDDIDRKLIELLTENARMSYVDLAGQVGLSRVAVKTRIDALEEQGIIESYTTIVNPQKISSSVSSYYEIEVEPSSFTNVVEILKGNKTVTQIYLVSGRNKLHVHAVTEDSEAMENFLQGVIQQLPGLLSLSSNIILARIKDVKGLRL